jgi:polysaccharide export outer membrane protein
MKFSSGRLAALVISLLGFLAAPVSFADQAAADPQSATAAPAAAPATAVDSSYIIGPGDVLQVFVWRQPELSVSVPVRPDGKVSTPLVEDIIAVGKTPSQLAREMERVLSEYVRSPQVNVIVSQPVSTFSQIKIIGQVARPQAVPYREGITALDAVLAVGGLAPFAAGNRSKIVREENGKRREIKIRLDDLVNKGDMRQNLPLQPGDVLVIPESRF